MTKLKLQDKVSTCTNRSTRPRRKMDSLNDDGFDEDELRAALLMSMEQQRVGDSQHDAPAPSAGAGSANTNAEPSAAASIEPKPVAEPPEITIESRDLDDIGVFRKIMFNDSITTTDDKERWIYECITTASMGGDASKTIITESFPRQSHLDMLTRPRGKGNTSNDDDDAKPAAVPDSIHALWGLTQKHGGPCGVLAAIQAEMIRILLFGRDNADCETSELKLFYPFYATQDRHGTSDPITADCVKRAMAMAIGMILARAAIMPTTSTSEKQPAKRDNISVCLVLPDQDNKQQPVEKSDNENADKVTSGWISEILHPGMNSNVATAETTKLGLKEYFIICPKLVQITSQPESNEHEDDDSSPESKRRKKKGVTFATDSTTANHQQEEKLSPEEKQQQHQMALLALGVAYILLGLPIPVRGHDGGTSTTSIALDEYKASSSIPLDSFCGPGGVMFLMMSLVQSRGIDVVKNGENTMLLLYSV